MTIVLHITQRSVYPSVPVLLTKDLPWNEISYDFQPPFSLHILNPKTKSSDVISTDSFLRHRYFSCSLHQQKEMSQCLKKKGSTYNPKAVVKRKIIEICQCEKGLWVLQQKSHDFLPTLSSFFLVEHFSLEAKRTSSTSMKYVKSILKILWTLNDLST